MAEEAGVEPASRFSTLIRLANELGKPTIRLSSMAEAARIERATPARGAAVFKTVRRANRHRFRLFRPVFPDDVLDRNSIDVPDPIDGLVPLPGASPEPLALFDRQRHELVGRHVAFPGVARRAARDFVLGIVRPASRARDLVVHRHLDRLKRPSAVKAPHGHAFLHQPLAQPGLVRAGRDPAL